MPDIGAEWPTLSENQKELRLKEYLDVLISIEEGTHELSNTWQQGKLVLIRKQTEDIIKKIIDIENG